MEVTVKLAADPALRARLGDNGQRFAAEHYARAAVLDRYEAFLRELSGRSH